MDEQINILVLGDSHTKVFEYANDDNVRFNFSVVRVDGATAQGCVNPNSETNALHIFNKTLQSTKRKNDYVLIMLGEVDCGYLIWVRSKRYGISVDHQIDIAVDNLFDFIKNKVSKYFTNQQIIIVGSVLPTINDNADPKFLSGARAEVDASLAMRSEKTLYYNNILQDKAKEYSYHYIEITKYIIGENGIVNSKYLSTNLYDHHLDDEKTYGLWLQQLATIIT